MGERASRTVSSISEPSYEVLQQAAEWFAILQAGNVSELEQRRWQDWLEAAEEHREAWRRVERINAQFESLHAQPGHQVLLKSNRRRVVKVLAAVFVGIMTGTETLRLRAVSPYWRKWTAAYKTSVGETRQLALADGTRVWLNTDSAMDVDYSSSERRIRLLSGEIMVQSAHDSVQPSRPLIVESPDGNLQALGTRFSVRVYQQHTRLAVFDGAVRVAPHDTADFTVIHAGWQVAFSNNSIATPSVVDEAMVSWARGVLMADNIRLGDFIAEVARYRPGYLACDPSVASLRLVGVYPLGNTDLILEALQASLPVKVHHVLSWWTVVEPR